MDNVASFALKQARGHMEKTDKEKLGLKFQHRSTVQEGITT